MEADVLRMKENLDHSIAQSTIVGLFSLSIELQDR